MEPYKKFLNESLGLKELLEIYIQLRQHFQDVGLSQKDLENPPVYTPKMMDLHHKFGQKQKALLKQVNDYGFSVSTEEFLQYMKPILTKLDEITPLSHVDYERRNSWDEDIE